MFSVVQNVKETAHVIVVFSVYTVVVVGLTQLCCMSELCEGSQSMVFALVLLFCGHLLIGMH